MWRTFAAAPPLVASRVVARIVARAGVLRRQHVCVLVRDAAGRAVCTAYGVAKRAGLCSVWHRHGMPAGTGGTGLAQDHGQRQS